MAKTFRGTFMAGLVGYYTNSDAMAEAYQRIAEAIRKPFTSGSGDNQAELLYLDPGRSLASTSKSYELDALASDVWGDTITFSKIRFIIIQSLTLTTGKTLSIGGDFNTLGVVPALVYPGSVVAIAAPVDGFPVAAGSTDTLTIDSGGNTVVYNLLIGGND